MSDSTTLYELNEYLKRVIALNFQEPIWVSCEISQVSEVRGQVYMDLIQQDEATGQVIAQSSAAIWYKQFLFIKKKLGDLLPAILTIGTHVLVKVKVEYHERYGVKLVVEDIDPSYTIGQMEMARQKILQQLTNAEVIHLNAELSMPRVMSRVAVVSSATAAGYKDFVAQLEHNDYGYRYSLDLFPAAMQGANTEREVCQALDLIAEQADRYDCIVLIRGGGSKLDLSGFDNYNIGFKISKMPIPVLTGIGHEIDQSVADIVAHTALKTPTAVASYLIDHNVNFEAEVLQMGQQAGQLAKQTITEHKSILDQAQQILILQPKSIVARERASVDQLFLQLKQSAKYNIKELREYLEHTEHIINLSDPKTILKRGYAMVKRKGEIITSADKLAAGDEVDLVYSDEQRKAKII